VAGGGRPVLAVPSGLGRRLSEALRLRVPGDVPPGPGDLLGLELEFSVRSVRGGRVHFGSLIHRLALDGTALDPGDPNAYRCSWGGVITSDGTEAEIATPPVRTRPGFTARLQGWARTAEAELRRAVPRGIGLDGYSAHFSAAMPPRLNDRECRLYAETFAAPLMMLMDRIGSPGLLVRPRPGRTELCGEFVHGETLAAAAFVAGSTRACAAAVRRQSGRAALPPRLDVRLAPAVHRYGWYVDREAFGTDLHAAGRRALLRRAGGGTICAQCHLELAWAAARQALAEDAAASDLQAAEAMVTGCLPLPAEQGRPDGAPGGRRDGDVRFPPGGAAVPDAPPLRVRVRPGFTLRPVAATWDFTVFEASGPARSAYACIPRDSLPGFAAALEDGALDEAIAAYLALPSRRRVLSASRQTARPGLYDQMGAPAGLLAPERDPQTGRQEAGESGAKRTLARPGKRNRQQRQEQAAARKTLRFPRAAVIAVAAAVVVAAVGVAGALLSRGHSGPAAQPAGASLPPSGVSFQPSALVFPAAQVNAHITRSFTVTDNGTAPATITQITISGPSRHDFSVLTPTVLDAARRGGQGRQPAAQPACHRRIPHAQTCTITVAFTPVAPGSHTADLHIHLASSPQPQRITLRGTATTTPPPPSSSVTVTALSPTGGTAEGGTSVTITGRGFTAPTASTGVSFGSAAAQFTIDSATQITATSPPGTGTVHVTVTTPAGTSATTPASRYRYTQTATAMTTTALLSSANPSAPGQPVTFTATVSPASGSGTPTGTVTFSDGGSQIGTTTLDSGGTATITTTAPLAAGRHVITASYGGDQNFSASSRSLTQTVNPALTSYTVTFDANGGTGTMAPETSSAPAALTANAFTQKGYSFAGWNTAADGSGTAYADTATYPFTASVTLYAQWTALNWPQLSITGPASIGPCAYLGNNPGCPSAQFTASGGDGITSHYTWSATGLPGGVTVSSTGQFGGNPTEYSNQPYPVTVTVTDSYTGQSASMIYQLTVNNDS
jgi:uncharacterized repeat protein (TIGR02543 family)